MMRNEELKEQKLSCVCNKVYADIAHKRGLLHSKRLCTASTVQEFDLEEGLGLRVKPYNITDF